MYRVTDENYRPYANPLCGCRPACACEPVTLSEAIALAGAIARTGRQVVVVDTETGRLVPRAELGLEGARAA